MKPLINYGDRVVSDTDEELLQLVKPLPNYYLIQNNILQPKKMWMIFEIPRAVMTYTLYLYNAKDRNSSIELQTTNRQEILIYLKGLQRGYNYAQHST